jgi:hypothetical protein
VKMIVTVGRISQIRRDRTGEPDAAPGRPCRLARPTLPAQMAVTIRPAPPAQAGNGRVLTVQVRAAAHSHLPPRRA